MNPARFALLAALALLGASARAQDVEQAVGRRFLFQPSGPPPCAPAVPLTPGSPVAPGTPGAPAVDPNAAAQPPATDAFAQASESGTQPAASYQPSFFGDLIGVTGTRAVFVNGGPGFTVVRAPITTAASGFKITDAESPLPMTRVYYNYNLFTDVGRAENAGVGGAAFNVQRHILGLEKAFLNGNVSLGLRLPWVVVTGPAGMGLNDARFGDLAIVTKVALVNNPCRGRLLSAGLVVTAPTGGGITVNPPDAFGNITPGNTVTIYEARIQPFTGYVRNLTERLYVHGFSSIIFPTDSRDAIIATGDTGVGYWLYRNPNDRFVQGLVPTVEMHTNSPLTHRNPRSAPIRFNDQLNFTYGVFAVLPRSVAGFAVGLPVMGPRPYTLEYAVNYQLRF